MGNEVSTPKGPLQVSDHVASAAFPRTLHMIWLKHPTAIVFGVAAERGGKAIYSLCMPRGWGGPMILFPGDNCKGEAICVVERSGGRFTIHLPGVAAYGLAPCKVIMISDHPNKDVRYAYTVGVGSGYHQHHESFEWRRTTGAEIKGMGGSGSGFKLLRAAPQIKSSSTWAPSPAPAPAPAPPNPNGVPSSAMPAWFGNPGAGASNQNQSGGQDEKKWGVFNHPKQPSTVRSNTGTFERSGTGFSKDGKEVIAVFGDEKKFSLNKIGGFQFLGSGNSPEMGYHATLMAFFSAMIIYQYENAMANGETGMADAGAAVGGVVSAAFT